MRSVPKSPKSCAPKPLPSNCLPHTTDLPTSLRMLSLYPQSATPLPSVYQPKGISQEVHNLRDAVEPFKKAILRSRITGTKLLCTIPTWGSTDDSYWDFNDLQEQRARLLVLIHDLIKSLRSAGIIATYSLTPSNSSRCVVCALPPDTYLNQVVISEVEKARSSASNGVSLVEWSTGPCLVVNQ
ncbi:hypothetical protein D9611_006809 [Ephemerocybe angulata]|uniref:Uncharacterized protein n=2 Tax=Ephemerocybe angulata TaxID=980116 RepID=A0A8H5B1I2_9AGAR|nr:hypothetical protein D9611_006809 [Tulosesus angulatus]KAF6766035.1 hypothetical protein DFP72DRAFT_4537 [Tulosesus angulatus]